MEFRTRILLVPICVIIFNLNICATTTTNTTSTIGEADGTTTTTLQSTTPKNSATITTSIQPSTPTISATSSIQSSIPTVSSAIPSPIQPSTTTIRVTITSSIQPSTPTISVTTTSPIQPSTTTNSATSSIQSSSPTNSTIFSTQSSTPTISATTTSSIQSSTPTNSTTPSTLPTTPTISATTTSSIQPSTPTNSATSYIQPSTPIISATTTSSIQPSTPTISATTTSLIQPSTTTNSATLSIQSSTPTSSTTSSIQSSTPTISATTTSPIQPSTTTNSATLSIQSSTPTSSTTSSMQSSTPTNSTTSTIQPSIPTISATSTIQPSTPTNSATSSIQSSTPIVSSAITSSIQPSAGTSVATPSKGAILVFDTAKLSPFAKFNVSINKSFPQDSAGIHNLTNEFKVKLTNVFKNSTWFEKIVINGLRSGSVICDYTMVFKSKTILSTIKKDFEARLKKSSMEIGGYKVNTSTVMSTFVKFEKLQQEEDGDACILYDSPYCGMGYDCTFNGDKTSCKSQCDDYDCGQGQCVFDHYNKTILCSCPEDDDYAYSGPRCETKTEKLALSKDYIIAISASCGGFVIIAFVIALVIVKIRRKQAVKSDAANNSFPDLASRNDRQQSPQIHRNTTDNDYVYLGSKKGSYGGHETYEMPVYFKDRQYEVLNEDDGTKAYIYSPTKQGQGTNYIPDRSSIGSSLQDFPQEKVDIPRVRIGRW